MSGRSKKFNAPTIHTTESVDYWIDKLLYTYRKNKSRTERGRKEMRLFFEEVNRKRKEIITPQAISHGGCFLEKAHFPPKVFYMMVKFFGRHWLEDKKVMPRFLKRCRQFCINEESIPEIKGDVREDSMAVFKHIDKQGKYVG
jgi:hypothetical protein